MWSERLAVVGLAAAHLVLVAVQVPEHCPAMDEPLHLVSGHVMWTTGQSADPTHPPLARYLMTLPLVLLGAEAGPGLGSAGHAAHDSLNHFIVHNRVSPALMLGAPRAVAALLSLAVVLLGWRWSRRLWGQGGGLFTLALLAFSPLLLADAPIVGNDVACALTMMLAVAAFGRYLSQPTWWTLALFGLSFFAAQATKFSNVLLVPICAALYLAKRWWERRRDSVPSAPPLRTALVHALVVAAGTGLLMWACYQFEVMSVLEDPQIALHPRSAEIKQRIAELPAALRDLPIPMYSFWKGLVVQAFHAGNQATWTEGINHQFLFGWNSLDGWRHYFPAAMAVKTPIPFMALGLWAAVIAWRRRSRWRTDDRIAPVGLLLLPAGLWLLFCMLLTINIGIRYVLPVYPLCAIAIGGLWCHVRGSRHRGALMAALVGLASWQAIGSVRAAPHLHAYFNEAAGGPAGGWRYLNNSSLDWGQDLPTLARYLRQQSIDDYYLDYFGAAWPADWGVTGFRTLPTTAAELAAVSGVVVVSQTRLTAQGPREPLYRRLRAMTPVAQVGWTLFVYRL